MLKLKILKKLFLTFLVLNLIKAQVDYKQYDLDSSPKDLYWCGSNKDKALVITELNSLYRSDDKGFSWRKLNDIITNTGKQELDKHENEVKKFQKFFQFF